MASPLEAVLNVLNKNHVFIANRDQVSRKLQNIKQKGVGSLQVIVDFDNTITKQHHNGVPELDSFVMFNTCPSVTENYVKVAKVLRNKYQPINADPSLSKSEKLPFMEQWWNKAEEALIDESKELFEALKELNVPVLIFSAGIGDFVEVVLRQSGILFSNMKIVANFLKYDSNGIIQGFQDKVIHILRKNETVLKNTDFHKQNLDRNNVLLIGDSLGDSDMSDGIENLQDAIKIGFLYNKVGREPNTNYSVQYLHYRQAKNASHAKATEDEKRKLQQEAFVVKYDHIVEKKQLRREINDRVKAKMQAYEEGLERRRHRLEELLCREEREYFYETALQAQKGEDLKFEEQKQRAQLLKSQREAERLKLVEEKRRQQYTNRCQELRPVLVKKRLIETKYTQLQQMRDNESRREAERELDKMWYELSEKDRLAKLEREEQELLEEKLKQKEILEIRMKQMKGKELMKAEVENIAKEDRMEMEKLREQLRREEIEGLDAKRRKRDQRAKELLEQISIQQELLARRKKEEHALDEAFSELTKLEIEREKNAIKDYTSQARHEMALYRKNLEELEEERKREEKELTELLEIHKKEVQKKQDDAKCKIVEAKRKLQQDVLAERAQQLVYKRQEAEQQLRLKEAENELMKMAYDTNERLEAEHERQLALSKRQHGDDLLKQIEYNNILKKREQEELKRQIEAGLKEEEANRRYVEQLLKTADGIEGKHPFRRVLERYDCYCPPPSGLP